MTDAEKIALLREHHRQTFNAREFAARWNMEVGYGAPVEGTIARALAVGDVTPAWVDDFKADMRRLDEIG